MVWGVAGASPSDSVSELGTCHLPAVDTEQHSDSFYVPLLIGVDNRFVFR